MKNKSLRPIVSLGMFDMFKGIGIFSVVFGHSFFVASDSFSVSLVSVLLYGFVCVSGFGFRRKPMKSILTDLKRAYLLPYCVAAICSIVLRFAVRYVSNHGDLEISLSFTRGLLYGFLLFESKGCSYFGIDVSSCGPTWFVVTLCVAIILFNHILSHADGWKTAACVLFCGLLGSIASKYVTLPFSLLHALTFIPGLYIGWLAKKYKWFEKKIPLKGWIILAVSMVVLFLCSLKVPIHLYCLSFPYGLVSLITLCSVSFFTVFLFTRINRHGGTLTNALEWLGRNSYYILFVHSISMNAKVGATFITFLRIASLSGCVILFFFEVAFIAVGMPLFKRVLKQLTPQKRIKE